ncbi:LysR family transcriptional regulator [Variovorax sp. LjRoot178]|uniref:LysR family transcriptional regulator n=1 Tax=Variovorax sp. LjRoot178 TaxID=3342277 RepID=UPI003ECFA863
MLDFNEVAMFVSVVEAGSFAEAARRLGMPPSTLSRRVQWLERRFGVRLMQRSTRQLGLTEAGRKFFDQCRGSIGDIVLAGREMLESNEAPCGSIRVAAPAGFFSFFKPEWVTEFLARHSRVKLEFTLNDAAVDLIAERIDLALREGHLPDSSLVARKIDSAYSILVASPAYMQARGTPRTAHSLSEHDCLVLPHPGGRSRWLLTGPDGPEAVEVKGRFSVDNHQAMTSAALAGMGIALIPAVLAVDHVRARTLAHVLPDYRRENGGLYAVFPSRRHQPLAASLLADFLAERMARFWSQRSLTAESSGTAVA